MATNLQITELDFDTIKANLIEYLKTQDSFKDYDYEASGMNVLMDILSYNTHYNALMVNYMANEMFIDSAQRRDNVVSHAKGYGYAPRGYRAPYAIINLTVNQAIGQPDLLTLRPGVTFETVVNDVVYQYVVRDTLVAYKTNSNTYVFNGVKIYEGDILKKTVISDGSAGYYVTLDNSGIDSTLISVKTRASINDITYNSWQAAESIINIDESSRVYFLEETFEGKYKVIFGDDVIGKKLGNGEVIEITYQKTSGAISNGASKFTMTGTVEGNSNVTVVTVTRSSSGTDAETLEQIKFNAINYYRTQNRAVTATDYKSLIKKYGSNVREVITWGGETENPPQYGKVLACVIPVYGDSLTSEEYAGIKSVIADRCVANTILDFVRPDYLDIGVTTRVTYNPLYLTVGASTLKSNILTGIIDHTTSLENFATKFVYSNLVGYIDSVDASIVGNETAIQLIREVTPSVGLMNPIEFSFVSQINQGTFISTAFKVSDSAEQQIFTAAGNTIIRTTVAGVIVNNDAGSIDWTTGEVKIKPLVIDSYVGDYIKFYGSPVKYDVYGKNNTILRIKDTNISITVTAEV